MLIITYMAEVTGQLTYWSVIGQFWALPFLIFLRVSDINKQPKWTTWGIMTLLLVYPWGTSRSFTPRPHVITTY
jgi:hypothetical protein